MVPRWSLIFLVAALLLPASSAQLTPVEYGLFMTSEEQEGEEVLAFQMGTSAATHTFSPVAGGLVDPLGPTTYTWTTKVPFGQDLRIEDDVTATLYFGPSADGAGTTTVTLRSVTDTTALPIASATADGMAQVAAHTETFPLTTQGAILPAGSYLRIEVSMGGLEPDVLIQLNYGDTTSPSGIDSITLSILDSDGDGFGDTAENLAGTDPEDALDYPGAPPPDDLDDDGLLDAWEDDALGTRNQTALDDPDEDGCDNACEQDAGTDPLNPDTDMDGRLDGAELEAGTDPLTADPPEVVEEVTEDASQEAWRAVLLFTLSSGVAGIALMRRFT